MTDLPPVRRLLDVAPPTVHGHVSLTHDERLIRRKRLVTTAGEAFLVDLPEGANLDGYWGFELEDGRCIRVAAADEPVLVVTGPDLARYAWHIGNRHTPCRIEPDRLVIRADHVIEAMLKGLGATVVAGLEPFAPESGTYGMGRPMGHDHGHGHVHHHSSHGPGEDDEEPDEP